MRTGSLNCPVPDLIVHNALSPGTPTQAEDLDTAAAVPCEGGAGQAAPPKI